MNHYPHGGISSHHHPEKWLVHIFFSSSSLWSTSLAPRAVLWFVPVHTTTGRLRPANSSSPPSTPVPDFALTCHLLVPVLEAAPFTSPISCRCRPFARDLRAVDRRRVGARDDRGGAQRPLGTQGACQVQSRRHRRGLEEAGGGPDGNATRADPDPEVVHGVQGPHHVGRLRDTRRDGTRTLLRLMDRCRRGRRRMVKQVQGSSTSKERGRSTRRKAVRTRARASLDGREGNRSRGTKMRACPARIRTTELVHTCCEQQANRFRSEGRADRACHVRFLEHRSTATNTRFALQGFASHPRKAPLHFTAGSRRGRWTGWEVQVASE